MSSEVFQRETPKPRFYAVSQRKLFLCNRIKKNYQLRFGVKKRRHEARRYRLFQEQ